MKSQSYYDKILAAEMNGCVYEHVWVSFIGVDYLAAKDYYLVENGLVYLINNGTKQPSGDSLEDTKNECSWFGTYNPELKYEAKREYYSSSRIKELLKLY